MRQTRTRPKPPRSPDRRLIAAVSSPTSEADFLAGGDRSGGEIALLNRQVGWMLPSKTELAGRTGGPEFGATYIAPHGREAAMARVAHDLLVRDAVLVGRGDEPRPHAMRRDRLPDRAANLRLGSTLLEDLSHGVGIQPSGVDRPPAIDLAEDRAGLDLGFVKPEPQRRHRTRLDRLTARNADLRAGAFLVGLRADDEQTQAF